MTDTSILLGHTGLHVCRIGFGGIPIQRLPAEQSDRLLEHAIERGIQFFDSARAYTDSEAKLGRVLPRHRQRKDSRIVVASKSFSRDAAGIYRDVETSLKNMRLEYIDIYQLHNVSSAEELQRVLAPDGAVSGLLKAQQEGKIGHIGITGHKPWVMLQALKEFPFATLQVPFNYMETAASAELIPWARSHNVGRIAMKPIGGGNITCVAANLRFIMTGGIDVAIPGMDEQVQVDENLGVLEDLRPPGPAEIIRLEEEKRRLGDSFCRRCEYCMPCPQGLPIAFLHVLRNYWFMYNLKDWVRERLHTLAKSYPDCTACGQCVSKCPYALDTPELFRSAWAAMCRDTGNDA